MRLHTNNDDCRPHANMADRGHRLRLCAHNVCCGGGGGAHSCVFAWMSIEPRRMECIKLYMYVARVLCTNSLWLHVVPLAGQHTDTVLKIWQF